MLKQRVISAIVMIAVVFAALFLFSPFYFALALGAIATVGVWEWTQFARFKIRVWRGVISAVAGSFLFLWLLSEKDYLNAAHHFFYPYAEPLLLAAIIWWVVAVALVLTYPKSATIWKKSILLQLIFAFLSLIPFVIAVLKLRLTNYIVDPYQGIALLLYVFVLVWAADSGAYFVGRKFGKHKLAPQVSPGKTWQGVIGGVITAGILASVFLSVARHYIFSPQISTLSLIILSIATVAISVFGDLTESMFKRESGIKDSGNFIPGHGGILDRIDSLLAATPFFAYFYFFILQ